MTPAPALSVDQRAQFGEPLTDLEVRVLQRLADGFMVANCGRQLSVSARSVRRYLRAAQIRLGAKTTTHAVAIAVARGIVTVTDPATGEVRHG